MEENNFTIKSQLAVMLTCPVCQDIFKDPRQLPCGHSFCMACLEGIIDFASDIPFRCPDCRTSFGPVVGVQKSYALASIADDFRESQKSEQKEMVFCDCCLEMTEPAIKSCLRCQMSLCKEHLQPHLEYPVLHDHPLVTPLGNLRSMRCVLHEGEALKYYCSSSKTYVCYICSLEKEQRNLAVESSNILEKKLTDRMNEHYSDVMQILGECKESVNKIKEEIREELITNSKDSWINIVTVVLLCLWLISVFYAHSSSADNQILKGKLEKQESELYKMYHLFSEKCGNFPLERHKTKDIREELDALTLNDDSASPFLKVSRDLQSVERVNAKLSHPSHPARFEDVPQVLSSQCFSSGRRVWKVEVEGSWNLAVSYASIQRKGKGVDSAFFGGNAVSWSLMRNDKGQLFAYHDNNKKMLQTTMNHSTVAVVVDFGKDTISFLEVGATVNELHKFIVKLAEPVCLGIGLYSAEPLSRASIIAA